MHFDKSPQMRVRLMLIAVFVVGVLIIVRRPDRSERVDQAGPGTVAPADSQTLATEGPASSAGSVRPVSVVAPPVVARRVETPPLPAVFSTYPVVAETQRAGPEPGDTEVRRIVRAPLKYPWIRVRSIFQSGVVVAEEAVVADQLLVSVRPEVTPAMLFAALAKEGIGIREKLPGSDTLVLQLPDHELDSVDRALSRLAPRSDLFESVDPNGIGFGGAPNDPRFGTQWALQNTGQSGGAVGADVNASGLWSIVTSAPKVLVAVLDSGMDFAHQDLAGIAWANPAEIPGNGIDDDGNGRVDDVNGWDFVNSDNTPADDHDHGSHVTGIIAARRENGVGITGLADPASILPCKILNSLNTGFTSDLIAALDYARLLGARVMNLSLQNYPTSGSFQSAIDRAQSADIVLCICAGNQGVNNNLTPNYPSSFTNPNIIAVANHDRTDVRWNGVTPSNYSNGGPSGAVDLFAPGRDVVSTIRNNSYSVFTGTSMSCPHVTAVAAIIRALNPAWTSAEVKSCILETVTTRPAYTTLCVTGGRLNAEAAIKRAIKLAPNSDPDADGIGSLVEYSLSIDPLRANGGGLPVFHINGPSLELTYSRARTDVSYSVESSGDLITWNAAPVNQGGVGSPVTATVPLGTAGQRYLRLKIETAP